jgi:hypothetical protein
VGRALKTIKINQTGQRRCAMSSICGTASGPIASECRVARDSQDAEPAMSVKSDRPIRPGGCSWRKITSRLGPLRAPNWRCDPRRHRGCRVQLLASARSRPSTHWRAGRDGAARGLSPLRRQPRIDAEHGGRKARHAHRFPDEETTRSRRSFKINRAPTRASCSRPPAPTWTVPPIPDPWSRRLALRQ